MAISTKIKANQKWAQRAGVVLLCLCAIMTFTAGWQLGGDDGRRSSVFGAGFAIVTLAAGILLPFVGLAFSRGIIGGLGLLVAWSAFTAGEFAGHLMVVAGQRHAQIEQANFQDTKSTDQRKSIAENEDLERTLKARKKDLEEGKGVGAGWSSTRPVEAWEADIRNAEGDQVFKRSKSCASVTISESRAFCDRLTELRANLAAAKDMAKAEEQLAATSRKLESLRKEAQNITTGNSIARTQSDVVATLMTISLAPDGSAKQWANFGLEVFFAFLLTIGPMSLLYVGVKDWDAPKPPRRRIDVKAIVRWVRVNVLNHSAIAVASEHAARMGGTVHVHHEMDEEGRQQAADAARRANEALDFKAKLRAARIGMVAA